MAKYRIEDLLFKALLPAKAIKALSEPQIVYHDWKWETRNSELKASRERGKNAKAPESNRQVNTDSIILVDIDHRKADNQAGRFYDRITLPVVPSEISFDPEPQWATIASLGRNAPFYNYSGSEDTLTFQIDWFSKRDDRRDVLYACRWVEALTKADAYGADPHRIMIVWGKDDKLFQNDIWIVHKASYKLSQFQKHRSMLPQQAYQEITLKKVLTDNSNMQSIFGSTYNYQDI